MPKKMQDFVLTDAERKAHVKKYPLPKWCKATKKKKRKKRCAFLSSPDWKMLRDRVIHYYGAVCMCCGNTKSINVDHIKPKSKYPELSMVFDNLQVLCWRCNRTKNTLHETDYRNLN